MDGNSIRVVMAPATPFPHYSLRAYTLIFRARHYSPANRSLNPHLNLDVLFTLDRWCPHSRVTHRLDTPRLFVLRGYATPTGSCPRNPYPSGNFRGPQDRRNRCGPIINRERGRAVFCFEPGPRRLFVALRVRRSPRLDPGFYTYI
jgi:hypothetical protein